MLHQLKITVHDREIWELLKSLRNRRGLFVEMAVREFLKTKKGKEYLEALLVLKSSEEEGGRNVKSGKGNQGRKRINLDDLLSD